MHNYNFAIVVCALFLLIRSTSATTVVVAVTPTGIVVGADGKTIPSGTAVKIRLLKGRLVVADIYAETAKLKNTGTVLYDFPAWIEKIDKETNADVSVNGLADIISDQVTKTFSFAIDAIKNGQMTRDQAKTAGVDTYLVQYVIAGYDNRMPAVYSITLMPDWDAKIVNGPFKVPLKEEKGERADSHVLWRGQGIGIAQAMIADTDEQKELATRIPIELPIAAARKDLTMQQASNVIRALLGVEAKANPRYVGLPFTVITVPRTGGGTVATYERDVTPLSVLAP